MTPEPWPHVPAERPRPDLPEHVTIVEVGPRDGLQNESAAVSTADKVAFVDLLTAAGLPAIEVAAFVSPRWVPRMADADQVLAGIARRPETRYTALVPNPKGLARALDAGLREIAIFAAASESFSRRNINQTIDESLDTYARVCREAVSAGIRVRAYLSTAFGCPYEGEVPPDQAARVAARLVEIGAFEVSVSDTIGVAHPGQVPGVVRAVRRHLDLGQIALHFHDTRGTALANVLAGLECGVTVFDASAGGLGGCPYAPGAAGNLATDDLVYMLDGLRIGTGVELDALSRASQFIASRLDHPLPSRYAQARAAGAAL
jgi:hydroxymethylglutaryl-CoA lyase